MYGMYVYVYILHVLFYSVKCLNVKRGRRWSYPCFLLLALLATHPQAKRDKEALHERLVAAQSGMTHDEAAVALDSQIATAAALESENATLRVQNDEYVALIWWRDGGGGYEYWTCFEKLRLPTHCILVLTGRVRLRELCL